MGPSSTCQKLVNSLRAEQELHRETVSGQASVCGQVPATPCTHQSIPLVRNQELEHPKPQQWGSDRGTTPPDACTQNSSHRADYSSRALLSLGFP